MYSVATLREDLTIVVAFQFANRQEHHTANIVIPSSLGKILQSFVAIRRRKDSCPATLKETSNDTSKSCLIYGLSQELLDARGSEELMEYTARPKGVSGGRTRAVNDKGKIRSKSEGLQSIGYLHVFSEQVCDKLLWFHHCKARERHETGTGIQIRRTFLLNP